MATLTLRNDRNPTISEAHIALRRDNASLAALTREDVIAAARDRSVPLRNGRLLLTDDDGHRRHADLYFGARVALERREKGHACMENAVPCTSDGPLGHGFECGLCGAFLQAG